MALRRPHKRMKIAGCRGSLAGKKLRRYGLPHLWTPAPYRGTGHAFIAMTNWVAGMTTPAGVRRAAYFPTKCFRE